MRQLATIQKIIDIQPIPNADAIEVATVLGWKCVVAKRDNFKVGDAVVYVEIDSIVPDRPEFEFLRDRKFRVRTIRLRGQISQGLVLPLSILPPKEGLWKANLVGTDVTELLGITKYESKSDKDEQIVRKSRNFIDKFFMRFAWYRKLFPATSGKFPSFVVKTDETRIQSMPRVVEDIKNLDLEITEKLDGQSATFFLKKKGFKYEFGVCSRNWRLPKPDGSNFWKIAKQLDIETVLRSMMERHDLIVIQGEIVGEGIQKNKYKLRGLDFYVYNLVIDGVRISPFAKRHFDLMKALGLKCVPKVALPFSNPKSVDEWVDFSNDKSAVNVATLREGIVVRNYDSNISFKVINPFFLLKNEE